MTEVIKPKIEIIPPDGGWGWVVCFAYALSNVIVIPIMQSFGLIFKSKFAQIGMSATDTSIIINTNSAFGMMMGLVNGSLLNKYGYRKCSIAGGLLISGGVILTSFANSFGFFLFSYGLITSLGFGLSMSAFSLALNSYFKKKRGRATGFAMTGTGLGPIIMPLIISVLLDEFGTSGTVLIVGGLSLNTLVAGALLQPLKWHVKKQIPEMTEMKSKENDEITESLIQKDDGVKTNVEDKPKDALNNKTEFSTSTLSIDHDVETQSIYGFETPLPRRKISQSSIFETGKHKKKLYSRSISQQDKSNWQSTISIDTLKSLKSINEKDDVEKDDYEKDDATLQINSIKMLEPPEKEEHIEKTKKAKSLFHSRMINLARLFDLSLLKDPIYINLMLGMSLAICAEINFSLLTPFILNDFGISTLEIAQIMSTIAISDIIFRFCSPYIADWLHKPPKVMYMFALVLLITTRTALLFVSNFSSMMVVAVALGIAKGFRTVFMSLLIPCYVPLERLAAASGIQMVANGIIIMIGGPLLGVIRDLTGSYDKCIIVINFITLTTIIMWTIEYFYMKYLKKR